MTADTIESTQLVSVATTTEIATSVVENGPTIDTSQQHVHLFISSSVPRWYITMSLLAAH